MSAMRLAPRYIALVAALGLITLVGGTADAAGPLDDRGALKSVTCAACHGQAGNSRSNAMPIIAGLDAAYLKKQIEDYAVGKRLSAEMEPYAKQVLNLGVDDVVAYFASRTDSASALTSENCGWDVSKGCTRWQAVQRWVATIVRSAVRPPCSW